MKTFAVLVALACAASAQASAVAQLRQRLAELRGTTAVAGKLEIVQEETRSKKQFARRGSAEFECDPAGLRMSLSAHDLSGAAGPNDRDGVARIDPRELWGRLNAAPSVLHELRKATVIGEQASTWKDRPATRLEVSVEPGPLEDAPRMLKAKIDIRRIFWVASDGTPLGSETRVTFSARFLVISATGQEKGSEDYEVIGDRLVITREVEESTSSAMGEKGRNTTTTTISLRK